MGHPVCKRAPNSALPFSSGCCDRHTSAAAPKNGYAGRWGRVATASRPPGVSWARRPPKISGSSLGRKWCTTSFSRAASYFYTSRVRFETLVDLKFANYL